MNALQYWALHSAKCCVFCAQDAVLKQHTERLANAVDMARTLQRNEETLLKDKVETVRVFCVLLPLCTIVLCVIASLYNCAGDGQLLCKRCVTHGIRPSCIQACCSQMMLWLVMNEAMRELSDCANASAQFARMLQVKRNHASLSDQLLRIMRALDALEGRFAVAAHHHNSKTYQTHEALSHDLSHLEAGLAPNSAGQLSNTVSGMSLCPVCDAPCHYCVNAAFFPDCIAKTQCCLHQDTLSSHLLKFT